MLVKSYYIEIYHHNSKWAKKKTFKSWFLAHLLQEMLKNKDLFICIAPLYGNNYNGT